VKLVAAIKESTLYPILRKLETGGYLTTYSEEFQGRKRKYYSITEEGRRQLEYLRKEWREYRNTVDDIVEGRVKK
jgi:transcriptional regulator, padR family